jgi:hypothetical protein
MCFPLAIPLAAMAVSAGSAVAANQAQGQQAKAQAKYGNKMYSSTAAAAMQNYQQQIGSSNLRVQQEGAATDQQAGNNAIAGMQSRSRAAASAGESGVEGNSVSLLLNDFSRIEADNNFNLYTNLSNMKQQSYQDLLAAHAGAQSQVAGVAPRPVQGPSSLGLGLNIANSALTFANYNVAKAAEDERNR